MRTFHELAAAETMRGEGCRQRREAERPAAVSALVVVPARHACLKDKLREKRGDDNDHRNDCGARRDACSSFGAVREEPVDRGAEPFPVLDEQLQRFAAAVGQRVVATRGTLVGLLPERLD